MSITATQARAERAIARLLVTTSQQPLPCGAAILIAPGLALTCAHAVNASLDRDRDTGDWPQESIAWDLPPLGIGRSQARVLHWCPPAAADAAGGPADIAVLALDPPLPPDMEIPALVRPAASPPPASIGHAYGFPEHGSAGVWAEGKLSGHQAKGWRQIQDQGEPFIRPGFSGGPFLDASQQCVIGMVVARHQWYPLSYVIPVEILRQAWPGLDANARWTELPRSDSQAAGQHWQHRSEQHVNVVVQVQGQPERNPSELATNVPEPADAPASNPPDPKPARQDGPPILSLRLDRNGDAMQIGTWPSPHQEPSNASLSELRQRLEQQGPDALFSVLFDTPAALAARLGPAAAATDPSAADPAQSALRLRLICHDAELNDLPWHCLSQSGRRLGAQGWIIEQVVESDGVERSIALDNPLVIVPEDEKATLGARMHAADVRIHLRRLLADQRTLVPWVSRRREIQAELARRPTPDLIYCFAEVSADGQLDLGRDQIAVDELLASSAEPDPDPSNRPILWLHLLERPGHKLDRALLLQLRTRTQLLIVQSASRANRERSAKNTGDLIQAIAEQGGEPAAAIARTGDRHLRCWLNRDSIRLRPEPDAPIRVRIRQALVRILLGRTDEKLRLHHELTQRPAGTLLLYAACGDRDACVHDFPEQLRQFIDDHDDALQLINRPLPCSMRPSDSADNLLDRLKRDLSIGPGRTVEQALLGLPVVSPAHEDAPVIALCWLLRADPEPELDPELNPAIEPTQLADWMRRWKEALTELFQPEEIPHGYRLLAGACIEWPAAWFEGAHAPTAKQLYGNISSVLRRGNSGHVQHISLRDPFGVLSADDLLEFYATPDNDLRQLLTKALYQHNGNEDDLVDYIVRKTDGRFEPAANLIYSEWKNGYADFRADQQTPQQAQKP